MATGEVRGTGTSMWAAGEAISACTLLACTKKGGKLLTNCESVSWWCCHELSQFQVLSDYFADNEQLCRWEHLT